MLMTITNEDNMEMMARYPDNHFELAIVDPPYEQGKQNRNFTSTNKDLTNGFTKISIDRGDKTSLTLGKRPSKEYFLELFRVSKNQMIFGMQFFTPFLHPSQCCIVWDKVNPNGLTFSEFELIYTSFPTRTRIVKRSLAKDRHKKKIHITQKPVYLYEWLLMNYAKSGDKILDTHLGSGSIAVACYNLGFELTACEINKDYFTSAIKRIKQHKAQLRMF